jgi:hypothetical protein
MATFDIFNDNAFSVSQLSQTIVDIPRVPTMLGDMGLFTEYGINTPTMMIERKGAALNLVPAVPRGARGEPLRSGGRKLIPVAAVHLPQEDRIEADVVYGVRAFGTESELESIQNVVRERMAIMKGNLDLTIEWQRVGALKGLILDADGTTVLRNIYTEMGFTQETIPWNIDTPDTAVDVKQKAIDLKRKMQLKLGGRTFKRVRVISSTGFFDKMVAHESMKTAWKDWNNGEFLRTDQSEADFVWQKVVFTIYDGMIGDVPMIPVDTAYAFPEGVPRMFQIAYAPANYMETVNTNGLPYYAKQAPGHMNKWVELESQSNPIALNTLPECVFKLTTAAT